jgi:quercetin dioxygenase-like cupin family protein
VEISAILKQHHKEQEIIQPPAGLNIKPPRMELLKNIAPKELAPGLTGYYAHGTNMTLGLVEIKAGSNLPEHKHVHEQITYILEGQLDMNIGGEACTLTAGMYHVIPSNMLHSAIAKTDCKVMDVFNPVREDYK